MEFNLFKKSDYVYWIWLALKLNNQNSVFQGLLDLFNNSAYEIYRADEKTLERAEFLTEYQRKSLLNKELDALQLNHIPSSAEMLLRASHS